MVAIIFSFLIINKIMTDSDSITEFAFVIITHFYLILKMHQPLQLVISFWICWHWYDYYLWALLLYLSCVLDGNISKEILVLKAIK